MFSERLDLLMNLTNVQNNALAHAVSIDASYISRLRRGKRPLPENQTYVMPMSGYLARQVRFPQQRQMMCDALNLDADWPEDVQRSTMLVYSWLMGEDIDTSNAKVERFLSVLAVERAGDQKDVLSDHVALEGDSLFEKHGLYYGIEGKKEAVSRFLTTLKDAPMPQKALLFSDEEMSWLIGDPVFTRRWANLLGTVLLKGTQIKIIHTVRRGMREMLEAVTMWLPLYMMGSIEPYYYPEVRDSLFQRSLFIQCGSAAIVSNSVNRDTSDMLNIYLEDRDGVRALETEYRRLLACCKPLMRIHRFAGPEEFWDEVIEMAASDSPAMLLSPTPSPMTMPESVARGIASRTKGPGFLDCWRRIVDLVNRPGSDLIEIITCGAKVEAGSDHGAGPSFPLGSSSRYGEIAYDAHEYQAHLENLHRISQRDTGYRVRYREDFDKDIMVYAKKDVGVVIAKLNQPTTVFVIEESGMTSAIWEYLSVL